MRLLAMSSNTPLRHSLAGGNDKWTIGRVDQVWHKDKCCQGPGLGPLAANPPKALTTLGPRLQRAFGLASPNRFAGGLCTSRIPCYTLRGDDDLWAMALASRYHARRE